MINVAILGITGYLGAELKELLSLRDDVKIIYAASRYFGKKEEISELKKAQAVFLAWPHRESMEKVPEILELVDSVIDLSGAYRLKDSSQYPIYYDWKHRFPLLLEKAVYGLPEKKRGVITAATLVANPGCYETAMILGLMPFRIEGLILSGEIEVKAVSGYTGAGKEADIPRVITPYKGGRQHQHIPAVEQELNIPGKILFYPNIAPFPRGILAIISVNLKNELTQKQVYDLYGYFYNKPFKEPFIRIKQKINLNKVIQTNFCDIAVRVKGSLVRIVVALDNLGKGGSSQAIQNFNIMYDLPETKGLLNRQP